MTLYGLTCGFWTENPELLDAHVILHALVNTDELYDLFEDQAPPNVVLHQCNSGIEVP